MDKINWVLGLTPDDIPVQWKTRITELLKNETGEYYNDSTFKMLQIPEWQGNKLLIDQQKYPEPESLVGIFWCKPITNQRIRIVAFVIDKKYQSRGFGTIVINEILEYSKNSNHNSVQLEVRCSNIRAQKFYQHFGFQIVNKINGYYSNEDGYLMSINT